MRKITYTIVFCSLVFITVLLLTACTLYQGFSRNTYSITGEGAAKFIGRIRAHKGNAESHYALGCYLQERKRHKPAIEEFKAALEIDPDHVKAYNCIGVSCDAIGECDRAIESYKAALKISGKLDYVLNNLGYSYLLQGKTDLAIENFKKALELDAGNARYRNNLGLAYANSGQYEAAFTELKEAGDAAKAHYNIAHLYYQKGFYNEAEVHFEQASLLKASEPEIERGLKAASSLAGIVTNNERAPQEAVEPMVYGSEYQTTKYDKGGFYAIPTEALEKIKRTEVMEVDLIENQDDPAARRVVMPVLSSRVARVKVLEGAREEVARVLEARPLALYDEAQLLELVSLQIADMEKGATCRVMMEVSNGNGVRNMARKVGNYLNGKDFAFYYLRNAGHFRHEETKIYYTRGHLREACVLAQELPGRQSLEEVAEIREGKAQISILIGKDLIPHLSFFNKG
ncbi:MAG: tetratricopeptide repeat protein [Deltaproteobacteria bacterium]